MHRNSHIASRHNPSPTKDYRPKVISTLPLLSGPVVLLAAVWVGTIQPAQANTPSLSATVNDDRSVTLTLSNGPSDWWFIVRQGSCTAATGTTADGGRGYDPQFTPPPGQNLFGWRVLHSDCRHIFHHPGFFSDRRGQQRQGR